MKSRSAFKTSALDVEQRGGVGIVTFEQFRLTRALGCDLAHTLNRLAHDPAVRAIVLTGRKHVFLSGIDLKEMQALRSAHAARGLLELPLVVIRSLVQCPKPTLAVVNGFCFGAGAELALACDFRIGVDQVTSGDGAAVPYIGFLHAERGMTPHMGGTQLLPRLVGPSHARELLMTARALAADEALRIGLLDAVAPRAELMPAALDLLGRILRHDAMAVRLLKALVELSLSGAPVDECLRAEREAFGLCRERAVAARSPADAAQA